MNHISMKQYADEKIANARRAADIQREVDKINADRKAERSSIISVLSALRIQLLKAVKIQLARIDQQVNPSES